MNDLEKR